MKFTVLLLYPSYEQENGNETYLGHEDERSAEIAIMEAQKGAQADTGVEGDDFRPLAVFRGWYNDWRHDAKFRCGFVTKEGR